MDYLFVKEDAGFKAVIKKSVFTAYIKEINYEKEAIIPKYAHKGDAGLDLYSTKNLTLKPNHKISIGTGISLELPKNYVGLVWDKSGIALKSGIKTMAGVIDSNYRGELKITLINLSSKNFKIKKGQKIAQLLIQKIETPKIETVEKLSKTSRGKRGFGSTGLN